MLFRRSEGATILPETLYEFLAGGCEQFIDSPLGPCPSQSEVTEIHNPIFNDRNRTPCYQGDILRHEEYEKSGWQGKLIFFLSADFQTIIPHVNVDGVGIPLFGHKWVLWKRKGAK